MNRNQFLIVTSLSSVVALLLILQIIFVRMANYDQGRLMVAQQQIQQGQLCLNNLQKLAMRIATVSQQTQDQGLKDLLERQQIKIGTPPAPSATDGGNNSAPAPAVTSPTTR